MGHRSLAIINCGQLVTLAGPQRPRVGPDLRNLSIRTNAALFIKNGLIDSVSDATTIAELVDAETEVVDAGGRVVMPGFVDAHTHPIFASNRVDEYEMRAAGATYTEIAANGGGIKSTVQKTRAASIDELVSAGKRYANWFLRNGTTTVEAKSGYGLTTSDELKLLVGIRQLSEETPLNFVPTFLGAHDIPEEYNGRKDQYIDLLINEMLPAVSRERLAEYCDVFCESGVFCIEESRRILKAAQAIGLKLRMHADQLSLTGGALLAAELGTTTADHLEHTDDLGIRALARARVQPVLLPGSVYALGLNRYPSARAMIDAGLAVVLATDFNPGSSPTPSMPMILSLASTHLRMTPAEAITATTINAACSLNRGAICGSIERGKHADLAIFDCEDYREIACFFGVQHTHQVYVRGRRVF